MTQMTRIFIFCFIRVNPSNPCHPRSKKLARKFSEFYSAFDGAND